MTLASCLLEDKKAFIILKASQGNETIQLYWFIYVAVVVPISSIPFEWFYSRIRIHMGGNSSPSNYSRSCSNINEHSAASWEDADLSVWCRAALLPTLPLRKILQEWDWHCDIQESAAYFLWLQCEPNMPRNYEKAGSLTLLMKLIFPVMLPNSVEKLFHLYLGTAVPADVQFLPLITF